MIGFILSVIVAVPLGILVGTIKSIEAFIEPLVAFVRYIPVSAFVPLSILWFGVGDIEKVVIIFIGIAPYLLILIESCAQKIDLQTLNTRIVYRQRFYEDCCNEKLTEDDVINHLIDLSANILTLRLFQKQHFFSPSKMGFQFGLAELQFLFY